MHRTTEPSAQPLLFGEVPPSSPVAYPGRKRGFGGGRYAAPYSGPYGMGPAGAPSHGTVFRDDFRAQRSDAAVQFSTQAQHALDDEKVASNYGGLRTHSSA